MSDASAARMLLVTAVICAIGLGIAGCSSDSSGMSAGGSTGLTLRVTRSTPLNPSAARFDKTVVDSAAVQRLYDAAIALPAAPNGVYNCPNSQGVVYHLAFFQAAAPMQHMDLEADGCRFLSIGQSQEQHLTNPDFLSLFTRTVGIASLT